MSCLEDLLRSRVVEGEAKLKAALRNPFVGGVARGYLPQTWVVTTDQEVVTVHADLSGNLVVRRGDTPVRDGAIAIGHDVLAESLRTGKNPPPNRVQTTFFTTKGEAAFRQLAPYFGL